MGTIGPTAIVIAIVLAGVSLRSQQPPPASADLRFDVVSIRENTSSDFSIRFEDQAPDSYRQSNLPLRYYVTYAYDVTQPTRLAGMPDWATTTRYDVVAKAARAISEDERRSMVRDMLASRFHLKVHTESRPQSVYVLTAVRPDRRLEQGVVPRPECATEKCDAGGTGRPDGVDVRAIPLARFASLLSNLMRQMVIDESGIAGAYDMKASWRPDTAAADPGDDRPSMFTALREQLGLKLEPANRPVEVLVIDNLERPTRD